MYNTGIFKKKTKQKGDLQMKKFSLISVLLVGSILIAACASPAAPVATEAPVEEPMEEEVAEEPQPSIVDIAVEDGRFTTLVAALQAAGLVDTLQGEGPFTVFAPTDDAFAALPEGTVESLLEDPETLSSILLYHVIAGNVKAEDVVGLDGQEVEAASGESFMVKLDGSDVMVNDAKVIITDIEGSNGVIHVIDTVILPPSVKEAMMEEEAQTIVDIAVSDENFSTLVTALQEAGLVEALQAEGPFTVFAPTNDAFAALPEGALEGLLADKEALTNVLLYHVVSGSVPAADVVGLDGQDVETLSTDSIAIKIDGENVMLNESNVVTTDIMASNGIIHVIDSVLLPPADEEEAMMEDAKSIVDIAVEDGRFTTLVTALQEADLVEALQGEGPFTVFAPTDDAFAALPEGALDELLADKDGLTQVLFYHVAEGKAMAADVLALEDPYINTLAEQYVNVSIDGDTVKIDESTVIIPDIEASNGVIHVIDSVLLPETRSIAEIAVEDGNFTTLVGALEAAGLVETLSGEGSFTVFAPTDDAFAALPAGALDSLVADTEALTNVLLYHVVDGKVMSFQVVDLDGESVETLSGDSITVMIDGEMVKINESTVIAADVEATNGVIHVIDAVLLP
jgi:transforming growth factor-beta-induced protein